MNSHLKKLLRGSLCLAVLLKFQDPKCSVFLFVFYWDACFQKILDNLLLQKRGMGGVDAAAVGTTFDISNLTRLGESEVRHCIT
jgi:hypothetical protein